MAKKVKEGGLPDDTIIEIVMKNKITIAEYEKIKNNTKSKGWSIQAYQLGVYSDGLGKKLD
ncbi:hypothetical protein [Myroides sp. LoEW2-1]|uniref:hypothetical protein n=1 Tax=Myroides sp. LoEW2-1 TaxID=2683192 RepID=UPI001322A05C|nr:hypothetical protein [Myroides sp. LoEW2-1]MVX36235.1 hypothetical protein [Myroides sp. LoEW2-1]